MSRSPRRHVTVYDPNGQNPYGNELALILRGTGRTVDHWVSASRTYQNASGIRVRSSLGGPVQDSQRRIVTAIRRLLVPVRAILFAPRDSPVVAAWTVDTWDTLVLGARSLFSDDVFVVLHNPRQVQGRAGKRWRLERLVLRRAVICLHSDRLAALAAADFPRRAVTPHPPYLSMTRSSPTWNPSRVTAREGLPRVGFIGEPRLDKGVADLEQMAERVSVRFELCILSAKRLPNGLAERIRALGHEVTEMADGGRPTDEEIVSALLESVVVVAPYRAVTESGSIRLATAVGVPVVAYNTDGVRELLPDSQLANDVGLLSRLVEARLVDPALPSAQLSLSLQSELAITAWEGILDGKY